MNPSTNSISIAVEPRVSVIIAVRNGADYLRRCLAAIANSNGSEYEVIVVDDASTDDTAAVAEAHGARVLRMTRRGGPGAARNLGVRAAAAPLIFFVDADVCIRPDAFDRVLSCLETEPEVDAVFGSYDDAPASPNLISQYKNLFHRFVHQKASAEACTFWSGCGAIRKVTFEGVGGFDVEAPSIEDIDLGVRLRKAGRRIRLDKSLEGTHLKVWRLAGLVRCDVIDRGIPWTRLILRERNLPTDLNLTIGQRLSAILTFLMLGATLAGSWWHPLLATLPLLSLLIVWIVDRSSSRSAGANHPSEAGLGARVGAFVLVTGVLGVLVAAQGWGILIGSTGILILLLNLRFYRFFIEARGIAFAILVVPLHLLYFIYSLVSLSAGVLLHMLGTDAGANKWRRLASSEVTPNATFHRKPFLERLQSTRTRRRAYAGVMCLLFVLACFAQGMKSLQNHEPLDLVVSDAEGYWVYLPSMVIDHNLTFTRQIDAHEKVHPIEPGSFARSSRGLINRWPVGVALTLAPSFVLAHGVNLLFSHWTGAAIFTPNGYSVVYQLFALLTVIGMSFCAMVAMDDLLERHFQLSGAAIGAGIGVCVLGSNWAYYIFREPFMSHAIGAAWVILAIFSADRLTAAAREGRVVPWHGAALVFALSMAVACRQSNEVLFPLALWAAIVVAKSKLPGRWLRQSPLLIISAWPLLVHLLVLRLMRRREKAQGGLTGYRAFETFHWLRPALFKTLFSDFHGLFFWSPILLLSIWGFVWHLRQSTRRRDGLVISLLVSLIALWYVNSAWYAWSFGKAFGARAFVDLIGVCVIGAALAFESLGRSPTRWSRAVTIPVALCVLFNWTLMTLFIVNKVPREAPLFPNLRMLHD